MPRLTSAQGQAETKGNAKLSKALFIQGGSPSSVPLVVDFDTKYDLAKQSGTLQWHHAENRRRYRAGFRHLQQRRRKHHRECQSRRPEHAREETWQLFSRPSAFTFPTELPLRAGHSAKI